MLSSLSAPPLTSQTDRNHLATYPPHYDKVTRHSQPASAALSFRLSYHILFLFPACISIYDILRHDFFFLSFRHGNTIESKEQGSNHAATISIGRARNFSFVGMGRIYYIASHLTGANQRLANTTELGICCGFCCCETRRERTLKEICTYSQGIRYWQH